MKHAVIVAHPNVSSFTLTIAEAYRSAAGRRGHDVVVRDLYRMGFDPCLKADELFPKNGASKRRDVLEERKILEDRDVFVSVYPLWFNTPPAILKGYIERVFGFDFGFAASSQGAKPLLTSRKLLTFSSSGAPEQWVVKTGAFSALRTLFDEHIAAVCGLDVVDHIHFGGITPNIRADVVTRYVRQVEDAVARYF